MSSADYIISCFELQSIKLNSKYIEQNKEVKIIHSWDGFSPKVNPLLYHFYIYLVDIKLKEFNNMRMNHTESYSFRGSTIWFRKRIHKMHMNTISYLI